MRMQQKHKKGTGTTIYIRLLSLFFLVCIPFFVLSLISNHTAETRLRHQSEIRMRTQLKNLATDYASTYTSIYSWMNVNLMTEYKQLLALPNVKLSSYQLGRYVSDLIDHLKELSQLSDFITDAAVYMPHTFRTVSLSSYYRSTISEDAQERMDTCLATGQHFLHLQDAFRLYNVLESTSDTTPRYVIEVTMSDKALLDYLSQQFLEPCAMITGDGYILCNDADQALMEKIRSRLATADNTSGQFVIDDYQVIWQLLQDNICFVSYVSLDTMLEPVHSFNQMTYITLALALGASILVCFVLSRIIHSPFKSLQHVFQRVQSGDMTITLETSPKLPSEFNLIYEQFNDMLSQINYLVDQRVQHENLLQQAHYRELQAHIAPHFLYNSFNTLRHCILMGDEDTAAQMTQLMANYFKYLTYKGDAASIVLCEEYQHMLDYLAIQKIRFGDSIHVCIDPLPEAYRNVQIPPFVLQPLVENIFKYGMRGESRESKITFVIESDERMLYLSVCDNGEGMEPEKLKELQQALKDDRTIPDHSGLVNVNARLTIYSGGASYVEVDSEPGQGFQARICLSIKEENHDQYSCSG